MLSICQPLALRLVFVMEVSDLGAVCHVWQWGTKMLPVQQTAGGDGTRTATDGADFTAGHFAGLFGRACAAWGEAQDGGTWVEFPMLARSNVCPAVSPPECSADLLSCWCCGRLGLLLGIEEWIKFHTESMPVWNKYWNLEVSWKVWWGLTSISSLCHVVLHRYRSNCSVLIAWWFHTLKLLCCWMQWWKGVS